MWKCLCKNIIFTFWMHNTASGFPPLSPIMLMCVMKGCGCNTACASLCLCSFSMWLLMLQQVFWVMCDCMSLTAYHPCSVRASHQAKGWKYSGIPWLCLVFPSPPCWAECSNVTLRPPHGQPRADRHTCGPLPAREAVVQSHEKVQWKT